MLAFDASGALQLPRYVIRRTAESRGPGARYPYALPGTERRFPAFRELVPACEFNRLGETFEKREHDVLGKEGFEGQVAAVSELEKQLGIYELSQFTSGLPQ